jgi:hypothetical protein
MQYGAIERCLNAIGKGINAIERFSNNVKVSLIFLGSS